MLNMYDFRKVSSTPRSGAAPARAGLAPMVFEHDSFRRGGQGELYLVQRRKRKKPEDARRDADREAEATVSRSFAQPAAAAGAEPAAVARELVARRREVDVP
mgnify:CR=1 FL=1